MKALVYYGPKEIALTDRPKPELILATDAIVKIQHTTICGTDLHVVRGHVPTVAKGRVLGHEGVGIVERVGTAVTGFKPGDRVLISCNTSCGKCINCRRMMWGQCLDGSWVLGNSSDGCQASHVRIPHADHSLYSLSDDINPMSAVMLSDVLPTAFELGIKAGCLEPGQSMAIVGAGPVGLAALLSSQFYSPSRIFVVDINKHRLRSALSLGASDAIDNSNGDAAEQILSLTKGRGVDLAIESIGLPVGFEVCEKIVCGGGNIAMLGVHSHPVTLHLEEMWKKNFTFTAGLVHTTSIPMLMQAVRTERLKPQLLITHHFKLSEVELAYETFTNADQHQALKVILSNDLEAV